MRFSRSTADEVTRMQPFEAYRPIVLVAGVPWMPTTPPSAKSEGRRARSARARRRPGRSAAARTSPRRRRRRGAGGRVGRPRRGCGIRRFPRKTVSVFCERLTTMRFVVVRTLDRQGRHSIPSPMGSDGQVEAVPERPGSRHARPRAPREPAGRGRGSVQASQPHGCSARIHLRHEPRNVVLGVREADELLKPM